MVRELLAEWSEELAVPARSGSTVESRDFVPPDGTLVVAFCDTAPVGCCGIRRLTATVGEVKRLFFRRAARRRGIGGIVLAGLERHAVQLGCEQLWLDTHAQGPAALFSSVGYEQIAAYNRNPYARYWFAKRLRAPPCANSSERGAPA